MLSPRTISEDLQREWLAGIAAGDMGSFRAIFDAYGLSLKKFASITVSMDLAEDIVQDVFVSLWERRKETGLAADGLSKYLFGAVRLRTLHYLRTERNQQSRAQSFAHIQDMRTPASATDQNLVAEDLERAIFAALSHLPQIQQQVISLRWSQGMAYTEIAEVLGITQAAAMQYVSRVKRVLGPILERLL